MKNFADVVTFIVENDLLASGDLAISIYKLDSPNGEWSDDAHVIPTFLLPVEELQVTFSSERSLHSSEERRYYRYSLTIIFGTLISFRSEIPVLTSCEQPSIYHCRQKKSGTIPKIFSFPGRVRKPDKLNQGGFPV